METKSSSKSNYKIVGLASLGAGLEFFDFTIYALFASYLSANFFPEEDPLLGLINTFAVFALGYLVRPIGGVLLGHVGDKYGRKNAFTIALLVMAIATLLVGCLPNYAMIGITAPILLVILRLIQGLSVGGEIPGAIIFTMEHFYKQRSGLMVGIVFMCITISSAIASLIGYGLTHLLASQAMLAWGWRIPFILGFILGIVGYILRRKALETPAFLDLIKQEQISRFPIVMLFKQSPRVLLVGVGLTILIACFVSFLLSYPAYLTSILNYTSTQAYMASTISFIVLSLLCPICGYFSDRFGRRPMVIAGAVCTMLLGYFAFVGIVNNAGHFAWAYILILVVSVSMTNGCYAIAIAEQFPAAIRYSGVGLCYNIGFAFFGGVTPLIMTSLIKVTHQPVAPYFYLLFCAGLTLIAGILYKMQGAIKQKLAPVG